jgi:molecular chaperone GrpE
MTKKDDKEQINKDVCECNKDCDCAAACVRCVELENNWKRALADYRNLEKRVVEEKAEFAQFANSILIMRILPILDNLEMLGVHIEDTGLKMTVNEFKKLLEEEGVVEIEAMDKEFDASSMDAVEKMDEDGTIVLEVVQKGYMLKNKIIRPARVKVGHRKDK